MTALAPLWTKVESGRKPYGFLSKRDRQRMSRRACCRKNAPAIRRVTACWSEASALEQADRAAQERAVPALVWSLRGQASASLPTALSTRADWRGPERADQALQAQAQARVSWMAQASSQREDRAFR